MVWRVSGARRRERRGEARRGGGRVRPFGVGQVDADSYRQPPRGDSSGREHGRRNERPSGYVKPEPVSPPRRPRVSAVQPVSPFIGARQRMPRADEGGRKKPQGCEAAGIGAARSRGTGQQGERISTAVVGRAAATCRAW